MKSNQRYKNFGGNFLNTTGNPSIVYQDPVSGIYKDIDGTYYLRDGTPLNDYDMNTGAYQEEDGTWYTVEGVALISYDKNTGSYQEPDGTWYDNGGNPIAKNSSAWSALQNIASAIIGNKMSGGGVNPPRPMNPVNKPNVQTTTPSWVVPVVLVGGVTVLGVIIYMSMKGKK